MYSSCDSWLSQYMESLSASDRHKIVKNPSTKVFKFGGGTKLLSQGEFLIPAVIAGKEVVI